MRPDWPRSHRDGARRRSYEPSLYADQSARFDFALPAREARSFAQFYGTAPKAFAKSSQGFAIAGAGYAVKAAVSAGFGSRTVPPEYCGSSSAAIRAITSSRSMKISASMGYTYAT